MQLAVNLLESLSSMKEVKNDKGFLVMEITRAELVSKFAKYVFIGVCDSCMDSPEVGYYVAVLNRWLCKKCYDEWMQRATRYQEDIPYEERNYEIYKRLFSK